MSGFADVLAQSREKNFRTAETGPVLCSAFSEGGSFEDTIRRRSEGKVEKPCVVAGHSETKALIAELLDGNRSEFEATLVTVSVFGVSGRGSRQQKLLEVLSWWPVQEIISFQHLWRVSSEVAYWCRFGNSQLLPACYLPFGPLK